MNVPCCMRHGCVYVNVPYGVLLLISHGKIASDARKRGEKLTWYDIWYTMLSQDICTAFWARKVLKDSSA